MKIVITGEEFNGSAVEIISQMKEDGIDFSNTDDLDSYMEWVAQNIFKMTGVGVQLPSNVSTEDKAAALLEQLTSSGLAEERSC